MDKISNDEVTFRAQNPKGISFLHMTVSMKGRDPSVRRGNFGRKGTPILRSPGHLCENS